MINKSTKPLISVITVVYNNVHVIEKTILSVLNQDYSNIEYLIIDGKSSDGTIEIIYKFLSHIHQFVSESDNGIYDAMNKGIDLASGDYIIFMNSGDVFYNNNVISNVFNTSKNRNEVIFGDHCANFGTYTSFEKASYPTRKNPMSFCHQAVFVKSIILKNNKFDLRYKICSDRNQFIQIFKQKPTYEYVKINISTIEAFGTSNSNRIATLREIKNIYKSNNMNTNLLINFKLFKGYCISVVEFLFGKDIINKFRRLIKQEY
ncbi:PGL/p-HBAD biosynthesis glycosyltransferase [bioreactor metagenome]|uniref:PGL/p-HBAD biosynthesis glycosyltransferase n=1 Tax=bioreactor metagenome TaxID=1076179 RepID=A0A645A3S4_9ZZZZ